MTPAPRTIVALGDSTTAGTPGFRSPLESPPCGEGNRESQYAHWLALAHPDWRILNRGINGERSDQIGARFERDVIDARADLVIIVAGVNDIYQGRAASEVQQNLASMYERARAAGVPVVAGTILPYNTATADQIDRMHAVNEWIRGLAARDRDVGFCDTRQAVADLGNLDRLRFSPDELHPSIDGYRSMADALRPIIEQMLESGLRPARRRDRSPRKDNPDTEA